MLSLFGICQPCSLEDLKNWTCPGAETGLSEDWEELTVQGVGEEAYRKHLAWSGKMARGLQSKSSIVYENLGGERGPRYPSFLA